MRMSLNVLGILPQLIGLQDTATWSVCGMRMNMGVLGMKTQLMGLHGPDT